MSQAEVDREKVRVYWDSRRSFIMTSLGFIFGAYLAVFTILNALLQAWPGVSPVFWLAVALVPVVLEHFRRTIRGTRKTLGDTALKTMDLLNKIAKNEQVDDELRKLLAS